MGTNGIANPSSGIPYENRYLLLEDSQEFYPNQATGIAQKQYAANHNQMLKQDYYELYRQQ